MWIVKNRKWFYILSGIVVSLSLVFVTVFGLKPSIDFTGGLIIDVSCQDCTQIEQAVKSELKGGFSLRESEHGFILRTKNLGENEKENLLTLLENSGAQISRFSEVGPTIGKELRRKAAVAIFLVVLSIILFIAFVFRHVSKPVSSWKYGVIAIVALLHDIIIPVGVFAVLGKFFGAEVGVLFVMALLAILGYSVNDTIVVFDRIRERLRENKNNNISEPFEETVGEALSQTIVRSINTSFTTLLVLLSLYFVGAESTKHFALTLIAGVLAGTYSSIFLASPLLVSWFNLQKNKK